MSDVNNQYDFFKEVNIDANGNLGVVVSGGGGGLPALTTDHVWLGNASNVAVEVNKSTLGGSVTADNGLTELTGNIELGGTLSKQTTINGAFNQFDLGTLGSEITKFTVNSIEGQFDYMGGPQGIQTTIDPGQDTKKVFDGGGVKTVERGFYDKQYITTITGTQDILFNLASNGSSEFVRLSYANDGLAITPTQVFIQKGGNFIETNTTETKMNFGSNSVDINSVGVEINTNNLKAAETGSTIATSTNSVLFSANASTITGSDKSSILSSATITDLNNQLSSSISSDTSTISGNVKSSIISSDEVSLTDSVESSIIGAGDDTELKDSFNSVIVGGSQNVIDTSSRSSIIGGGGTGILDKNTLTNVQNSVILGGTNINGTLSNMVYVPNLEVANGGNITLTGLVDGRDIATDGTKLDTIETGAEVNPILSRTLTLEEPTVSDDITIFRTDVAIVIQEVIAFSTGTSPDTTYDIKYSTDRSAAGTSLVSSEQTTSVSTGDVATISNVNIPANSIVWLEVSAASGTSVYLSLDIRYTEV